MKKVLGLVALFAVLCMTLLFGPSATTSAQQQPGPQNGTDVTNQLVPTQVLECYSVQNGDAVNTPARLVTKNFGGDLVYLRNLIMMCELSTKNSPTTQNADPPPAEQTKIFACYSLLRGSDPSDPFVLNTENFGKDVVTVRTANIMCESASKTVTTAAGGPKTYGTPDGQVAQCFRLDQGQTPNKFFTLANNNFGNTRVLVSTALEMCETAQKQIQTSDGNVATSGEATGAVAECFAIRGGVDEKTPVTLETKNFGKDEVIVHRPLLMCEEAEKTPIYTFGVPLPVNPGDTAESILGTGR